MQIVPFVIMSLAFSGSCYTWNCFLQSTLMLQSIGNTGNYTGMASHSYLSSGINDLVDGFYA